MITKVARTIIDKDVVYKFVGKSTDEKPISTNGSIFTELDTGKEYFFDGDEHGWSEQADKYLDSLILETAPTKTTYYVGDKFDATGASVKAVYTDKSKAPVTDFVVDAPEKIELDSVVALSYTENGRTRKVIVEIEINDNKATDKESFMDIIENGSAVVLESDITFTKKLTFTDDFELDLNGHELSTTMSADYAMEVTGGNVTIKGGSITAKKHIGKVTNGSLTIENGEFTSTNDSLFSAYGEDSKITVNGGKFTAVEGGVGAHQKATIEVNGGEFNISDNFAIFTNGTEDDGGNTIIINDIDINNTITSNGYEACGIYIANNDTFIMNGGHVVVNGGCGLLMRAGTVELNGGYIKAITGENVPGHVGDSNTNVGASAVIYQESADYPGKEGMSLTVNGGTFIGADKGLEILSNEVEPKVYVNGGVFIPPYVPAD